MKNQVAMSKREEKFWDFVMPEPNSGCWLWIGGDNGVGYGKFWNGKKPIYAHRFSYEMHRGLIPAGLQLDHLCRVPCCVNPDHLEAVTASENILRGNRNGNQNKTHCPQGHPYDGKNLYRIPDGRRDCRECTRRRGREYRARLKAAEAGLE